MAKTEEIVSKIKVWLKNPWNLALVAIIILAFAIRLYFFIHVGNQTLWWDEAEYTSLAKKWAFGVPYLANPQRPPLFQILGAIAYIIGFGESFIRFFLVLLPSTLLVLAVYLLGKEMFSRKIGLVAAFLTTASWTLLFWGARIQPDFASMLLQVLAIFFMWKYWKSQNAQTNQTTAVKNANASHKPKTKFAIIAAILAAISFYFKITGLLVPMIFILFILIRERLSALKNKDYWYFSAVYLLMLVPYFIWAKMSYGSFLAFKAGYSNQVINHTPFAWEVLNYYQILSGLVLFILFIIGVIIGLKFLLYLDVMIKDKSKMLDANLFGIISLLYIAAFYIFYQRAIEDRWLFLWLPFMFFFVANALKFVYQKIKPYSKALALIVIVTLLGFGFYAQLSHANGLINQKKDSYKQVELAGIWMKQNSDANDTILSRSKTQNTYYAERRTKSYNDFKNASEMNDYIARIKPKFFVISIFEPNPDWTQSWIDANKDRLTPVQGYVDAQQNPLLIVYQIKY